MNGKRLGMVLILTVLAGTWAFAHGGAGKGGGRGFSRMSEEDFQVYTGTLLIEEGQRPALKTSGGTFSLRVPPLSTYPPNGSALKVTGAPMPDSLHNWGGALGQYLLVTEIEFDGEVITPERGEFKNGAGRNSPYAPGGGHDRRGFFR